MPASKTNATTPGILQIKVTLLGTKPPIWRRVLVPPDLTLGQLHTVLQIAMGWQGGHLHDFRIGKASYGSLEFAEGADDTIDEQTARLSDVLGRPRAKALYTYDFGDGWEHSVVVEKILALEPDVSYPACTGGALQCPPEDCGGIPGFYDLLDAVSDPKHERHEEIMDWLGGGFDPDAFSVDDVNKSLAPFRPRRKKKNATHGV